MRSCVAVSIVVALALACTGSATAQTEYIGAAKCKMCHKLQYDSWQELKHALAFDLLKAEEQSNADCLKCHATGGTADHPGVQCEACHGPGSDYKSMKVMKDRETALASGLLLPTEENCRTCHEGAPHDQAPFDFEAAKTGGIHAMKNPR